MRAFDLEAAKRGEKVQYLGGLGGWVDVHVVGEKLDGGIVVQYMNDRMSSFAVHTRSLRMAPKPPKEMWVQLYADEFGRAMPSGLHENPDIARQEAIANAIPCKLLGEPQKVLVPEDV